MNRRLLPVLLMLCLCWQALAFAGAQVWLSDGAERLHALLHFEGEAHHHDEPEAHGLQAQHDHGGDLHQAPEPDHEPDHPSGGIHLDDSFASVQHGLQDAGVFAPVLLPAIVQRLPLLAGPPPPAEVRVAALPPPFLSGPERPPKALT